VIRVLIADSSASEREAVARALTSDTEIEVIAAVADSAAAVTSSQKSTPDVVLVDAELLGGDASIMTNPLTQASPAVGIIAMSTSHETNVLRQVMRVGAQDFLAKPVSAEELLASVHQVYEANLQRRALIVGAAATAAPPDERPIEGKIVCMFSPKGGVGRTTIAANLAIMLHKMSGQPVAIADCNLQFGDVGIVMNCATSRTIADLVPNIADLSPQVLDSVLVNHESGVRVLLAPTRPEVAELFHPEHVKQILQALRRTHEYVVVDTWTTFQEVILGIFDVSSEIILLTTLDMPAIKNIRVFLDVCDAIQYPKDKVHLVINRADASGGLSVADIEESVQHKVAATLVSAGALVTASINRGVPFVMTDPSAPISQNIQELARLVLKPEHLTETAPEPIQAEPRRRQGLGRLMPGF
jgi:pilus assembly protein CpaE